MKKFFLFKGLKIIKIMNDRKDSFKFSSYTYEWSAWNIK